MSRAPRMRTSPTPWRRVRALIMDVDGVLTDGGLYYTENGDELKRFDVRDGQGLVLLRQAGILTAIVTGSAPPWSPAAPTSSASPKSTRPSQTRAQRVTALLARHGVPPADACYVGDDSRPPRPPPRRHRRRRRRRSPDRPSHRPLRHHALRRPRRHPRTLRPHPRRRKPREAATRRALNAAAARWAESDNPTCPSARRERGLIREGPAGTRSRHLSPCAPLEVEPSHGRFEAAAPPAWLPGAPP